LTSRALMLGIIILIVTIATNWLLDEGPPPDEGELKRNDPDLYMLNATIKQFTDQGELHHDLGAQRFTHFPLTDLTTMLEPNLRILTTNDEPWFITADNGRLLSKSTFREEVVELWDNVLAIRQNDDGRFVNIQTESLTVYPEREYAETDQKVTIDDNASRTTAAGMKVHFQQGEFMFFSTPEQKVKTVFLPAYR
jgi:lipopolysaccharide export system protein LptC